MDKVKQKRDTFTEKKHAEIRATYKKLLNTPHPPIKSYKVIREEVAEIHNCTQDHVYRVLRGEMLQSRK